MKKNETNTTDNSPKQEEDTIHALLSALGFSKTLVVDKWTRKFSGIPDELEVDCDAEKFLYEKIGITVSSATTANFSQAENFVVFECVCRLLEKGYKPKDIELEPEWKLGHSDKSGRADIWVRTIGKDKKKHSLIIIECKTAGKEFANAWRDTREDGAQLFSYLQQERETKYLCLYASALSDGKIKSDYRLIRVEDNAEYLKTLPKSMRGGYTAASNNKELFAVWRDAYKLDSATVGLFEKDIAPYHPGKNKYSSDDLRELDHDSMKGKYHEFATIMRLHNVSGHENAFDKLVNLFLAKLVDEKRNATDLCFHWKGIAYDNAYDLQDRLQRLYTTGMKEFLGETVTYIDEQDVRKAFRRFERDPDATKDAIIGYFRELKFYTNNDFAFLDVHNERLFEENFAILLKIVQMLEDVRLLTDKPNQFLGDLFEGFLDRGVKQSEGQFFTPLPIVRFIVSSLPIQELVRNLPDPPRVIDYACGSGHFLNEYAKQAKPFIVGYAPESAREHYGAIVGVEKEYRLSKVAKVAAFMYGEDDMRIVYADALARHPDVPEGSFDLLVANPPYSVRGFLETLPEAERMRYELSETKPQVASFDGIQTYFVERAVQLLKPCGLAAIILPSSILSTAKAPYIRCRDILLRSFDIVAIAEFGSGTFGKTGTNTVTLFLRKKDAPPDFAAHCANRADAWLAAKHDGDEVFQDAVVLDRYCSKRGFDPADYRAFLSAGSAAAAGGDRRAVRILEHDAFRALRDAFAKRTAKEKWPSAKRADEEWQFLRAEERERLRVFLLADANPVPVLLVKMPTETKAAKAFLGYEWSERRGNEGIKALGVATRKKKGGSSDENDEDDDTLARLKGIEAIQTPLYDNARLADETAEKINSLVRKNFRGTLSSIPESLRSFARTVPLVDLLDFDATTFDRQIRTGISASAALIPSKFPLSRLGDVATFESGSRPSGGVGSIESGCLSIGGEHIHNSNGTLSLASPKYVPESFFNNAMRGKVKTNDLLICKDGALTGKVALVRQEFSQTRAMVNEHVFIVRCAEIVTQKYLFNLFLSDYGQLLLKSKITGSAQGGLNATNLANLSIPLPPLPVQQKVVDACAEVDSECAEAEKALADSSLKIAALFSDGQMGTTTAFKLSDKKLFSVQIGRRVLETQVSPDYSIPVFSANVFEPFGNIEKPLKTLTDFSTDSVLWGIDGDWMVSFMPKGQPFYPTDHCGVLRVKSGDISTRYLVHALEEAGKAAGFKRSYRASIERIEALTVTLPSLAEQKRIVAAVETEEAAIAAARQVIANAAGRKRTILSTYGILQE